MGRHAEGFTLRLKGEYWQVRFTINGRQRELTTGERNKGPALERARDIYAKAIRGEIEETPANAVSMNLVTSEWLASVETSIDPLTYKQYKMYCNRYDKYFKHSDELTSVKVQQFIAKRLGEAARTTVMRERARLLCVCKYAVHRGWLTDLPKCEPPSRTAIGKRVGEKKKARAYKREDIEYFIAALPEWSGRVARKSGKGERFPVRNRWVVQYETSLRPATIDKISVPEHYTKGSATLNITDEIDKARYGRELPLTAKARAALDACCPAKGLIFGKRDYRGYFKKVLKTFEEAGKKMKVTPYDTRHSRITALAKQAKDLKGVMFLAGHKDLATTAKYTHASFEDAQAVLTDEEGG